MLTAVEMQLCERALIDREETCFFLFWTRLVVFFPPTPTEEAGSTSVIYREEPVFLGSELSMQPFSAMGDFSEPNKPLTVCRARLGIEKKKRTRTDKSLMPCKEKRV